MQFDNWFVPKLLDTRGRAFATQYPTSKVVCVGRNYREHARELNNPVPSEPLLFIKPNSALIDFEPSVILPQAQYACHYEAELALLMGKSVGRSAVDNIQGVGLALDLTFRDLQAQLKSKGHPWEKAKAFDNACPITAFVPIEQFAVNSETSFSFERNGEIVQVGRVSDMIFSIEALLSSITKSFRLIPGDIVLTGTPAGVGILSQGDKLSLILGEYRWNSVVNQVSINHE